MKREKYLSLINLLVELGQVLDRGEGDQPFFRRWEAAVLAEIGSKEADRFMTRSESAGDLLATGLAGERWRNLKNILLARKGVPTRYLTE